MKKNIVVALSIIFSVLMVTLGTYSYVKWSSIEQNTAINYVVDADLEKYIEYNPGNSQFAGDFKMVYNYDEGLKSTVAINKTTEGETVDLTATLKMTVNEIGTNMSKYEGIRWTVTSKDCNNDGSSNTEQICSEGNFLGADNGDVLILYSNIELTTTAKEFTVWLWADASKNLINSMIHEKIDTEIWMEIEQEVTETCSITQINATNQTISATSVCSSTEIAKYAVTTTNTEPTAWINIPTTDQNTIYNLITNKQTIGTDLETNITSARTYYVWFQTTDGTSFYEQVSVTNIDSVGPTCTFIAAKDTITGGETTTVKLTCIDKDTRIIVTDTNKIELSEIYQNNTLLTIDSISEPKIITDGVEYTITVTGNTGQNGTVTLTLQGSRITNTNGTGNTKATGSINVKNTFTISYYNCNGTEFTDSYSNATPTSYVYGTGATLSTPTKSGYAFINYYTTPECNGYTVNSIKATDKGDKKLYAKWEATANRYTITFNANGGNDITTELDVVEGEQYGDLPTPSRTNYTFDGWYTEAEGGTRITSTSIVSLPTSHILYAHWTANTIDNLNVSVSGETNVGKTLTASATSDVGGVTYSYTWYSNTTNSTSEGTQIGTGSTYTLTENERGKYIYVTVSASATNYISNTATSTILGAVTQTYTYTATFNANGATITYDGTSSNTSINVSCSITTIDSNEGCKFYTPTITPPNDYIEKGWVNSSDNSDTIASGVIITLTSNKTYNAVLEENKNGAAMLISKANDASVTTYNSGNKGEMYTFSQPATTQLAATTDYRYIGNTPNNYITFNNETWRIIGVFDGKIKIIKDTSIGNTTWDNKQNGIGSSTSNYGSNDWVDSQLMYMLNPTDIATNVALKTGYTFDGTYVRDANSKIVYRKDCKPTSAAGGSYSCTTNTWSLNATALTQVEDVTYYLGGSSSYSGLSAVDHYTFERGTNKYNSVRSTNWTGKVGLMYPSDYSYTFAYGVDNTCYSNTSNCNNSTPSSSWLYNSSISQWTQTPIIANAHVFLITGDGFSIQNSANYALGVRPVVYLKEDIELTGSGTSDDKYEIVSNQSGGSGTTVTVTFNANGGDTTTSSMTVTTGSTYGTLPTPTKSGYTFIGWYTEASGGTEVTSSTIVTATENHTLYAQWDENKINNISVSIYGIANVDNTLTVNAISNVSDATYSYTWFSNTTNSKTGGTQIGTGNNYTLTENERGKYIYVEVIASANDYANTTTISSVVGLVTQTYTYTATFNANGATITYDETSSTTTLNLSCSVTTTADSGSCSITTPTITPPSGYTENGWVNESDSSDTAESGATITLSSSKTYETVLHEEQTGAAMLISKANGASVTTYSNGDTGEMYTFSQPTTSQLAATTDYRYIGSSPDNYIIYNDETWRIIGVFDGKIKIIKETSIGSMPWDYKPNYGSNDWGDSQLMYMLNYYDMEKQVAKKTGYTFDGTYVKNASNRIIYQKGCQPAETNGTTYTCTVNTWRLNINAFYQAEEATYYLGGHSTSEALSTINYYTYERGTAKYNSARSTNWTGKVGLIYPSDYGYTYAYGVNDACYSNLYTCSASNTVSWLRKITSNQWTLFPRASDEYGIFATNNSKIWDLMSSNDYDVNPVVYLKKDTKLTGTGTSSDPYKIEVKPQTGATMLINKANDASVTTYASGNKGEMYTFSQPATTQVEATTDYRYIGNTPNNYITFNNETWRIIGVFDGKIKIIKDTSIGNMSWDYKQSGIGSAISNEGSNDWVDSQLMYMLNPNDIATNVALKSGYTFDGTYVKDANSKIIYQKGCQPASTSGNSYSCTANTWSLNATALAQAVDVTYYLGGASTASDLSAIDYYTSERGEAKYNNVRSTNWTGKVGLMYPSDYAYTFAYGVDNKCYSDTFNCYSYGGGTPSSSWLFKSITEWTISPLTLYYNVFRIGDSGFIDNGTDVTISRGVRPVVYLKADIELTGSGTSSDPYEIATKPTAGAAMLISKANGASVTTYSSGNTGEMYTFYQPATSQVGATTDYRYIGSNPNNYITFNNETWQIIGVFNGQIKIIKETSIGSMPLDYQPSYGSNDWGASQLMYMLNPNDIATNVALKTGYTFDGTYVKNASNKIIYQKGCKPVSTDGSSYSCTTNSWSLNATALNQVSDTTYYLAGHTTSENIATVDYYIYERGTAKYNAARSTNWTGKVGLIYPSDYGYTYAYGVNDACYSNLYTCSASNTVSWLQKTNSSQWTLFPRTSDESGIFAINNNKIWDLMSSNDYNVKPVVYLKPDIELTGSGTSEDKYQIVS